MEYEFLEFEIDNRGVAKICLNRPEIHNAFNEKLIEEIRRLFFELDKDDRCRMAVLTGKGKSFCAGADLNWMKSMADYSKKENVEDSRKMAKMFAQVDDFSKTLIGQVNGHALGGGMGLVANCDYVVANERAKFGFTEVRLGLIPAVISPYCVKKIGISNARAWFLSGELFDASKAREMGLVHEACALEEMEEKTELIVKSFLKAGPLASIEAKKLIKNIDSLNSNDVEEYTLEAISQIRVSKEGQEGMQALLNKTKPGWVNE